MKIRKAIIGLVAATALAVNSGCTYKMSKKFDAPLNPTVSGEIGYDYVAYTPKIPDKLQRTAYHPDDGNPLAGGTKAKLRPWGNSNAKFGVSGSLENEYLRFILGGDLRCGGSTTNSYRQGVYATAKQPFPPPYNSQVFTQMTQGPLTAIPYVGLEGTINDLIILGAKFGMPYTNFGLESGHDRYGHWQPVRNDKWQGFGYMFGGDIRIKIDNKNSVGLSLTQETYKPRFNGTQAEIDAWNFNLKLEHHF